MSELEVEWLYRASEGDKAAFERLVLAYQAPVYSLCLRILGDPFEAEDAAQETFLRAYRSIGRYDPERRFLNWILTIASNHCVDRLRKRRLPTLSLEALKPWQALPDPAEGPEVSLSEQEGREMIDRMLDELRPLDRAAIVMRYWYDLSYEEIAEMLSLSVSAVKSRLHRARRTLAKAWLLKGEKALVQGGSRDHASAL